MSEYLRFWIILRPGTRVDWVEWYYVGTFEQVSAWMLDLDLLVELTAKQWNEVLIHPKSLEA